MGRKNVPAIILALGCLATACKQREPEVPQLPPAAASNKVYVICEGMSSQGNSQLDLYLPQTDSLYRDVYRAANGQPLGSVLQSMIRMGDYYFLCVNNSDKVVCIRRDNWQLAGTIPIPKPRYILPVSSTKAYVSTLFSDKVYIINPLTFQVTGTITLPFQNPEGMILLNGTAYIAPWDTACRQLYPVATATDALQAPVPIPGAAPQELGLDREGKLWVLSGNLYKGKPAMLTRMDPASGQVLTAYPFPPDADPLRLEFNATRDSLYFIEVKYAAAATNSGVYRMGIHDPALPSAAFIPAGAAGFRYFWALGIEPETGYIYVGDPVGFLGQGLINVYRQDGALMKSFRCGVGPGHFYFEK